MQGGKNEIIYERKLLLSNQTAELLYHNYAKNMPMWTITAI